MPNRNIPQKPQFSLPKGNAKIGDDTLTFSLPAGHSCPFAKSCLARANQKTGRLSDGPHQEFRCFSASAESAFPSVRNSRWKNWKAVKAALKEKKLAELLAAHIPEETPYVRIHVGGDFFSQAYFDAWMETARLRPKVIFYAYTKSIKFWIKRKNAIPVNLRLTASLGGEDDALAKQHCLPTAEVVFHPDKSQKEIDHDDSLARSPIRKDFALLIHGCQKQGSKASSAISQLKAEKIPFGYRKKAA